MRPVARVPARLLAALVAALGALAPAPAAAAADRAPGLALGLRLQRDLRPGDDVAVSPVSLQQAFAMVADGARGATRRQILAGLRLGDTRTAAAVGRQLAERPQLRIANAVWAQAGYPLRASFVDRVTRRHGAAPRAVDFASDPDGARRIVNGWAEERTSGRIREVFPPRALTRLTRLVLANALYLKADWERAFHPARTRDEPFHRLQGRPLSVPMMRRTDAYAWTSDTDLSAVELPYAGGRLAMDVIVPRRGRWGAARRRLTATGVTRILAAMRTSRLALRLPRFTVRSDLDLVGELRRLGVRAALRPGTADLRAMSPRARADGLHVAKVRQKVLVKVDETGTEAAAVTGVGVEAVSAPPSVTVDSPFVFLIRDRPTGAVVFAGRVMDPRP
jgi:serpin B